MAYSGIEKISLLNRWLSDRGRFDSLGPLGLDVILGIDWLATNYALVDWFKKEVTFRRLGFLEATFYGWQRSALPGMISTLFAHYLFRKGCMRFLANVFDTSTNEARFKDVPMV